MPGDPKLPTSDSAAFRLLVLGDGTVRTIPLLGERWIIGRSPDCAIPLRDVTVSRRHLLIERRGDLFFFQDLGGSNPVQLDGKPSSQGTFTLGQTLTIGLTRLILERRDRTPAITSPSMATVVLSREVIDEELAASIDQRSLPATAAKILERIEWTFADLGDLNDAAEPLLDLALNLTGRRAGFVARIDGRGELQPLSSLNLAGGTHSPTLPTTVLAELRRVLQPELLTTEEDGRTQTRLLIPLGKGPDGMVVLEQAAPDAPAGQELLRLAQSLGSVLWHRLQETTERIHLRAELQRMQFHGTVAHNALLASTRLQEARQAVRALAASDRPVLLCGEDGTEREDLARYLHAESPRQKRPLIAWNPARLKPWRHERDLLGDSRGTVGAVQRARGGTLFIDAVTSLDVDLQRRLVEQLRDLDSRGDVAPAFLVLAANTPPSAADETARAGDAWAPELLDWLGGCHIPIPPLRSDARDILALAELFLSEMGSCPDGSPRLLSERSKRLLVAHPWPGNVRELRLVLESAAASAGNQAIAPRHLPEGLVSTTDQSTSVPTLEEVERLHIVDVMQRTGGNRVKAAQLLGIATSTLYEKLKRLQLG